MKNIQHKLFTVLTFLIKWVSVNYERQISKNIKFRVDILGGAIMLMTKMIVNLGSGNGILCDRLYISI